MSKYKTRTRRIRDFLNDDKVNDFTIPVIFGFGFVSSFSSS